MKGLDIMIGKGIAVGRRAAKGAWWLCVCALVACTADDLPAPAPAVPVPSVPGETGIYVSGGRDKVTMTSGKRYLDPDNTTDGPQLEGVCRADRVDVYVYTHDGKISGRHPGAENHTWEATIASTQLNVMGFDRYAEVSYHTKKDANGKENKYHMASALAYSEAEYGTQNAPNFNVTTGENREKLTFSLTDKATFTPELYYGVLRGIGVDSYTENIENVTVDDDEVIKYYTAAIWSNKETDISFKGRIFRIVSQINLKVTDVEKALVEKMELLTDYYPKQIMLYGSHGKNYPVTACMDEALTSGAEDVLLDTQAFAADDALGTATVNLSSFLLPSEVGMHLKLRIVYRQEMIGSVDEETGEVTHYKEKTFDLQPAVSYYLTGNDAAAYGGASANVKNGNDLYVYDGRSGKYCFYSYANVRVNLTGPFDHFAASTSTPDIVIEVEPDFEGVHDYEIVN